MTSVAITGSTSHEEVTLLTCYDYQGLWNRWQGFRNMGLVPPQRGDDPQLRFAKMLGSGGGRGFDLWPNWGRYFSLTVWSNRDAAALHQSELHPHPSVRHMRRHRDREWSLLLRPYKAHGEWGGVSPFKPVNRLRAPRGSDQDEGERGESANTPIVVLTRARIKSSLIWKFWRDVPQVSRSLREAEGCHFAVGVGELPLIQQATISVWESEAAMMSYAYRSAHHREVIKKTKRVGWYREELFARFEILEAWGAPPDSLREISAHQP